MSWYVCPPDGDLEQKATLQKRAVWGINNHCTRFDDFPPGYPHASLPGRIKRPTDQNRYAMEFLIEVGMKALQSLKQGVFIHCPSFFREGAPATRLQLPYQSMGPGLGLSGSPPKVFVIRISLQSKQTKLPAKQTVQPQSQGLNMQWSKWLPYEGDVR